MTKIFNLVATLSLMVITILSYGQTISTTGTGQWNDGTKWSSGLVPTGGAGTVNVINPMELNITNLSIDGTYNFNAKVTDLSGGTAYGIAINNGTLNVNANTT